MKKQLLAIALLSASLCSAQVWSENFNTTTGVGLPANWLQNNVDGLTPSSTIASYSFGTNAFVTRNVTVDFSLNSMFQRCVVSTSRYNPTGTSNDWLISPAFVVPANGCFSWDATSFDPVSQNAYELRISTAGTLVADFMANPALFSINAEIENATGTWTQRGVSLAAYAGQTVRLAMHEMSTNKWQLAMDNFVCSVPANANDGSITQLTGLPRYAVAGNSSISGTFKQLGYATATTAVVNYKVNNNAVVTETITFAPTVQYFNTSAFTMAVPANLAAGVNTVSLWVSHVNGVAEASAATNTVTTVVYRASTSKTRNSLIEEFSSSTCAPCAALNSTFDPFLNGYNPNTGGTLNAVKYQVNWPSPGNDPSWNPDASTRRTFYAINAAPTALIDGTTEMANHDATEIANAQAVPAYAQITASLTISGTASAPIIDASASYTPYVSIPSGSPLKVYQALAQKTYTFANPSTSQTSFWHIQRKMFPSAAGTAITPVDGVGATASFNYTGAYATIYPPIAAQNSNNFWNSTTQVYEYVIWIQDATSGDILNSGSASAQLSTGLVELKNDNKIGVYPNPAQNNAVVGIKLTNSSSVDITIYDVAGKVVYSNKGANVTPGQNEISINTSEFANGAYSIVVNTNEGVLTEKLIINK